MTLRRATALLLLVAAMLAAWIWRGTGEDEAESVSAPLGKLAEASAPPAEDAFHADSAARPGPSGVAGRTPIVLPPLGTPPAQVVDALLPAARAGDARAQCRLGVELGACQMVQGHLDDLRRPLQRAESRAATNGDDVFAVKLAELELALTERRAACSSLDVDGLVRERDWLLEAARRGHQESAMRYLLGQSLGHDTAMLASGAAPWGVMRHPGWAAWQREAPRIADALLEGGHADVLFLLTSAYSDDNTPLGGLYPNDPVQRAAHQIALQQSEPGRAIGRDFTQGLAPGDVLAARKAAEALLARLRGGTASMPRMTQLLKPTATALLPRTTGQDEQAPCE